MPVHHAGIGSIQKAMLLLRLVAAQGPQRLAQLTAASGLNKVTALRILSMLVQEGMLRRLEDGLHYDLGPEAMVIAAASERRIDLRQAARASLTRLAALSDDTVILSVRSGLESLCLAIEAAASRSAPIASRSAAAGRSASAPAAWRCWPGRAMRNGMR